MPLTAKGEEVMAAMKRQYGAEKGEQVFYASKNAGTISGVDAGSGSTRGMLEGIMADRMDARFDACQTTLERIGRRMDEIERTDAQRRIDARVAADAIEVQTRNYEWTHGKKPSGSGSWAFVFNGKTEFAPGSGSYSEAKKWAQARAKELGATRVEVGT